MILLPIGHERDGTRRLPWITFGILGLSALAFVLTDFGGSRTEFEALESHERAIEYWMERPYLRLDPEIERAMHGLATREMRETFREGLRANVDTPEDPETLRAEQTELDRLSDLAKNEPAGHPFFRWGLVPSRMGPVTLVTHMFLHAGWLHLLGNLFILYLCAPFVEDVWGRPLFAGFYALAGIVAAISFVVPHADSTEPLVGASGAIAGVMGAFAVRFARTKIKFFYALGLLIRGTFWAPAWAMLGLWFAEQIFYSFLTAGASAEGGGGIAYLAHAGGFAFGVAVALGMKHYRVEERWLDAAIEAKASPVVASNAAVDEALAAAERGDSEAAWKRLQDELARSPGNVDAALALWSLALGSGRAREAAPAMTRAVEQELRSGQTDLAVEHWEELKREVPTASLDPRTLLRIAGIYAKQGHAKEASDALRRALLVAGRASNPALLIRIAEEAASIDPAVARAAAKAALARPDLDAAGRSRLQAFA